MAHVTLQLEVPDTFLGANWEQIERRYRASAVAKWYELGLVSQSRGAELLGLGREEFLRVLGEFGVAAMQADPAELDAEFGA